MQLPEINAIHSIVIRAPNWIGDAVMATPLFRQVRKIFPQARITVLAHDPIAQLLTGIDGIDDFLVFSRAADKKRLEEKRVANELKKKKFDLGILLTNSFSSAWMFWKGGVRWRLGACGHMRRFLLNLPIKMGKEERHDVLRYTELLLPFGAEEEEPTLELKVTSQEQGQMGAVLKQLGKKNSDTLIVINPGAAYGSAKCWPKEYFRAVAQRLSQHEQRFCVFVGDSKSAAMIEDIIKGLPANVVSLAGKTSLRDLMALISSGDFILSNDSGPMHIAAAFKRPLLALFGSTNPNRTGPWGCGRVIYKHAPCSPCYLRECPHEFQCMRLITPDEVLQNIIPLIS